MINLLATIFGDTLLKMYDPWALGVLTKCEVWQIMGRTNKKI
jgi:hypothetical protein